MPFEKYFYYIINLKTIFCSSLDVHENIKILYLYIDLWTCFCHKKTIVWKLFHICFLPNWEVVSKTISLILSNKAVGLLRFDETCCNTLIQRLMEAAFNQDQSYFANVSKTQQLQLFIFYSISYLFWAWSTEYSRIIILSLKFLWWQQDHLF